MKVKILQVSVIAFFILLFVGTLDLAKNNFFTKKTQETVCDFDFMDSKFKEILGRGSIIGFSVVIVNQNKLLFEKGYGFADLKKAQEYQSSTIQNVASISKLVIGIALLKAVELGKLSLDDPINQYLPFEVINPHFPTDIITIRHLATQTSGIRDRESYFNNSYILLDSTSLTIEIDDLGVVLNNARKTMKMDEYLFKVLSVNGEFYSINGFLNSKPGEKFEYTNIGSALAAFILERAMGESFEVFTSKYIFTNLKMSQTAWFYHKIDNSKLTRLYLDSNTIIPAYRLITFPDGGLLTSGKDLAKLLIEMIKGYEGKGEILNGESYNILFSKQLNENYYLSDRDRNQGIFIQHRPDGLIGHTGNDPGVSTWLFFNPDTKVGSIILVNTELNSEEFADFKAIQEAIFTYESSMN